MAKSHYLLCCLLICFTYYVNSSDVKPKQFSVNLDLNPEERWVHILQKSKGVKEAFTSILKLTIDSLPAVLRYSVLKIADLIITYLPEEYVSEMKGVANALNISVSDVCLLNILYDYSAFCTSIVAQDHVKGNIWHGRNLDYNFSEELKKMTVVIHFKKQGKVVYSGTTYLGLVGLITGQKPNKFTISLDERDSGSFLMNLLVASFDKKAKHNFFLIREVLENVASFEDAVECIQNAQTIAPAYFILGGTKPGQGAVITHGRLKSVDTWALAPENSRWFLVQTNYDHWKEPPKDDDRRHPAIRVMQKIGRDKINLDTMYIVLSTPPVLNEHTTYTTMMSAAYPELYNTIIRDYPGRNTSDITNKSFDPLQKNVTVNG